MNLKICVFVICCLPSVLAFANSIDGFVCPGNQTVVEGLNKKWITHKHVRRTFFTEFPDVSKETPVGVIFSWHGAGDSIETWRWRFPIADESTVQFPFIVITPHDVGLTPHGHPRGLSWDLFKSRRGDENLEAKLFEGVLGCLARTHRIDAERIYSAGFSAGAIVSNMLHSRYPQTVRAVFSASGLWLNDEIEKSLFRFPFGWQVPMDWDELNSDSKGTILLTDGGDLDSYKIWGKEVVSFHKASQAAVSFLNERNRTVVYCSESHGHALLPAITAAHAVRLFRSHELELPPSMRSSCTVYYP